MEGRHGSHQESMTMGHDSPNISDAGSVTVNGKSSTNLPNKVTVDGITISFDAKDTGYRRMVNIDGMLAMYGPGASSEQSNGRVKVQIKGTEIWVNGKQVDLSALAGGPPTVQKPKPPPPAMQPKAVASQDSIREKAAVGGRSAFTSAALAESKIGNVTVKYQTGANLSSRQVQLLLPNKDGSVGSTGLSLMPGMSMSMKLGDVDVQIDGMKLSINGAPVKFQ
jgi:hypothetical protein